MADFVGAAERSGRFRNYALDALAVPNPGTTAVH